MVFPAIINFISEEKEWTIFASTGIISFFIGMTIILAFKSKKLKIGNKETFLLTFLAWFMLAAISALPFYLSNLNLNYADSFFEATSGITTAGSTIISNLEDASTGVLLWRSILQWLGGIGIIVMAVAALPLLHMSGLQLFFSEQTEGTDKLKESVKKIASSIIIIYGLFTLICALCLKFAGMSLFDAICHSMTTIATGGYSTHNDSIGHYNNLTIELIIMIGMILASLPFILFVKSINNFRNILFDSQVKKFILLIILTIIIMALWLNIKININLFESLRISSFNVISIITGTGYSTSDFSEWGSFAIALLFIFMFIGGCTGSTTGGIKIFRLQILFAVITQQIKKIIKPHQVLKVSYAKSTLEDKTILSILTLIFLFIFSTLIVAAILCFLGIDILSSLSAAATAIAVVGPGLSTEIGPSGNFSQFPISAKWTLSMAMIIGRLEFFAVLILFIPSFWKK
tara:strand:+ start:3314 stop:4696 length:1383 start_codon:yes stop_codon:yes gene_type:complete